MQFLSSTNAAVFLMALLVAAGLVSSLVSRKFGAPVLLVFLVLGMLLGEEGPGGITFSNYALTYFIGSMALAVIMFDGGMRLKLADFKSNLWPSLSLATVGVFVTMAVVAVVAIYGLGFGWREAALLGAILASTDAAAVMSLLKGNGTKIPSRLVSTLEIESGTNDPVAIFLTMTLLNLILSGKHHIGWGVAGDLLREGLIGAACGVLGGYALSWALNRLRLAENLNPLFVLSGGLMVFGGTALLGGSGFLAVYIAGVLVGNRPMRSRSGVFMFSESITMLAQLIMFMALGLLVVPSHLLAYIVPALVVALTLVLVARPLAVWLCLSPFGGAYTADEKNFISWVGLRGAVAIFLASIPKLAGLPHADLYFNIAFVVVLISLIVKGWSIPFIARQMGLNKPTTKVPAKPQPSS